MIHEYILQNNMLVCMGLSVSAVVCLDCKFALTLGVCVCVCVCERERERERERALVFVTLSYTLFTGLGYFSEHT